MACRTNASLTRIGQRDERDQHRADLGADSPSPVGTAGEGLLPFHGLATAAGLEPATPSFEGWCPIRLSDAVGCWWGSPARGCGDASGAPVPMRGDLFSIDPVMLASSRSKALALLPQMPWIGCAAQPFALLVKFLLVWLWPEAWLEPSRSGPR